jgi:spermidine synthase
MMLSKDKELTLKKPLRKWTPEQEARLCRYYNSEIHAAAFILPQFAKAAIQE